MVKRVLLVVMAAMLVIVSFAGCGNIMAANKEKAYNAYKKLSESMGETGEYEADMVTTQKMMGMEVEATGVFKAKAVDGKQQMYMEMKTNVLGQAVSVVVVTDGSRVYYATNGQQINISAADAYAEAANSTAIPEFEMEAIKSCEVEKDGANTKYILILDGAELKNYIDQLAESMSQQAGGSASIELGDITYEIVVDKNDVPKSMALDMSFSATISGQKVEVESNSKFTFKAFSGVEIDLSLLDNA